MDLAAKYRKFLLWRLQSRTPEQEANFNAAIDRLTSTPPRLDGQVHVGDEIKREQEASAARWAEFASWLSSQAAIEVETIAPEIARELEAFGWDDARRGKWLIGRSMSDGASPFELIHQGKANDVLEWLRRARYGFTA